MVVPVELFSVGGVWEVSEPEVAVSGFGIAVVVEPEVVFDPDEEFVFSVEGAAPVTVSAKVALAGTSEPSIAEIV